MPKPRPGRPLHELEPIAALLSDQIDIMESGQVLDPRPWIEDVIGSLRFIHRVLVRQFEAAAREGGEEQEGDELPPF
jgi:hypothetical protein